MSSARELQIATTRLFVTTADIIRNYEVRPPVIQPRASLDLASVDLDTWHVKANVYFMRIHTLKTIAGPLRLARMLTSYEETVHG